MSLRTRATVAGAALACAVAAPSHPTALSAPEAHAASARQDALERAVLERVNRVRARRGLPPLRPSRALARSADRHVLDMLRHDFVSHRSVDGTPMRRRVRRYVRARAVGETIAYVPAGARRRRAARVVAAWLRSPGHRRVLLSRRFARAGLGRRLGTLGSARAVLLTMNVASRR